MAVVRGKVTNVTNVSAPSINQSSGQNPRMLKIKFTDGVSSIYGIEYEPLQQLSYSCCSVTNQTEHGSWNEGASDEPGAVQRISSSPSFLHQGAWRRRSGDVRVVESTGSHGDEEPFPRDHSQRGVASSQIHLLRGIREAEETWHRSKDDPGGTEAGPCAVGDEEDRGLGPQGDRRQAKGGSGDDGGGRDQGHGQVGVEQAGGCAGCIARSWRFHIGHLRGSLGIDMNRIQSQPPLQLRLLLLRRE